MGDFTIGKKMAAERMNARVPSAFMPSLPGIMHAFPTMVSMCGASSTFTGLCLFGRAQLTKSPNRLPFRLALG